VNIVVNRRGRDTPYISDCSMSDGDGKGEGEEGSIIRTSSCCGTAANL